MLIQAVGPSTSNGHTHTRSLIMETGFISLVYSLESFYVEKRKLTPPSFRWAEPPPTAASQMGFESETPQVGSAAINHPFISQLLPPDCVQGSLNVPKCHKTVPRYWIWTKWYIISMRGSPDSYFIDQNSRSPRPCIYIPHLQSHVPVEILQEESTVEFFPKETTEQHQISQL